MWFTNSILIMLYLIYLNSFVVVTYTKKIDFSFKSKIHNKLHTNNSDNKNDNVINRITHKYYRNENKNENKDEIIYSKKLFSIRGGVSSVIKGNSAFDIKLVVSSIIKFFIMQNKLVSPFEGLTRFPSIMSITGVYLYFYLCLFLFIYACLFVCVHVSIMYVSTYVCTCLF